MTAYSDSSALVKVILEEDGSLEMRSFVEGGEQILCCSLGYVELRAALAAATRSNRVPTEMRASLPRLTEELWHRLSEIEVDRELFAAAAVLAERFGLRAYDAVHLAAAVRWGGPTQLVVACWDTDLRRAAGELGYSLFPL